MIQFQSSVDRLVGLQKQLNFILADNYIDVEYVGDFKAQEAEISSIVKCYQRKNLTAEEIITLYEMTKEIIDDTIWMLNQKASWDDLGR